MSQHFQQGAAAGFNYCISLPYAVSHRHDKQLPWLLFLHGAGERGDPSGCDLHLVQRHGPWESPWRECFVIIAPQCPHRRLWQSFTDRLLQFVRIMPDRYPVDKQRCYCTGLSIGGFASWTLAAADSCLFAAIAPICGGFCPPQNTENLSLAALLRMAQQSPTDADLRAVRRTPAWLFHGKQDKHVLPTGSTCVYSALGGGLRKGKSLQLTLFQDRGHSCWREAYATQELMSWFLCFRAPTMERLVLGLSLIHI